MFGDAVKLPAVLRRIPKRMRYPGLGKARYAD